MVEIRDCHNRLACMGEAHTGTIEFCEKHQRFRAVLPLGGVFTVERKGARTVITRISDTLFRVESAPIAA